MKGRIKAVRTSLGLSQAEFGKRIGVRQSTIANYERGFPPLDAAITAICREFHVREEWLRNGTGEMKVAEPEDALAQVLDRYGFPGFLRPLFEQYAKLPEEAKKTFEAWSREAILEIATDLTDRTETPASVTTPPPAPPASGRNACPGRSTS